MIFGVFCLFVLVSIYLFFRLPWAFIAVCRLPLVVLNEDCSLIAVHWLIVMVSLVVAHRLSCPLACGIFLEKGLNSFPCIDREILNN